MPRRNKENIFSQISSILVIDDSPSDALFLKHAIKKSNFDGDLEHVLTANAAYQWISNRLSTKACLPDLVLLDLNLPGESGMEVLEKLKSTRSLKEMTVVVFSGSTNPKSMAEARQLGADWYFVKQSSIKELDYMMKTIASVCREKRAG